METLTSLVNVSTHLRWDGIVITVLDSQSEDWGSTPGQVSPKIFSIQSRVEGKLFLVLGIGTPNVMVTDH